MNEYTPGPSGNFKEYLLLIYQHLQDIVSFQNVLNDYASKGWQVIHVTSVSGSSASYGMSVYTLERDAR